jgi:hypothetical protein
VSLPTTAGSLTKLGPIEFVLPANAGEFRQESTLPPFVVATHVWSIGDSGIVSVTVQNVIPKFPPSDLVAEFDANGLHWKAYDTGKNVGAGTIAFSVIGGTNAVLVGGQAWLAVKSNALIRDVVVEMASSVRLQAEVS